MPVGFGADCVEVGRCKGRGLSLRLASVCKMPIQRSDWLLRVSLPMQEYRGREMTVEVEDYVDEGGEEWIVSTSDSVTPNLEELKSVC